MPAVARPRSLSPDAKSDGLLAPHPVRPSRPPPRGAPAEVAVPVPAAPKASSRKRPKPPPTIQVRRIHRRDLNAVWEFIKLSFRDVNRATVEYQRPRTKRRFLEVYSEEGVEQLIFEVAGEIVGYAECAFEASGDDSWVNPRYFERRDMRPLFVEELAVHPDYQGKGVGSFMLDQLQHLARVRGCTHLVLEVAENNERALAWYRKRSFFKLDAAIFMAQKLNAEPELLPPRKLKVRRNQLAVPVKAAKPAKATKPAKAAKPRARRKKPEPELSPAGVAEETSALPAAEPAPALDGVAHEELRGDGTGMPKE